MKLNNIKPLDGVRALAIVLVLIWHYFDCQVRDLTNGGIITYLKFLTYCTWSGVDLFFVLSGFLIGRILLFNRGSRNYFRSFYARRFLRIFPAYYLVLLAYFIIIWTGLSSHFPWLIPVNDTSHFYSYLFYTQNFWMGSGGAASNWLGVTWSLAVEEQFYLLIPLLVFLINPKYLPKLLVFFIILAPICRALLQNMGAYVLLPARMDSLSLGVLIAYFHLNGSLEKMVQRRKGILIFFWIILFLSLYFIKEEKSSLSGIGGVFIHTVLALFYGIFIVLAVTSAENSFLVKALSKTWMSFIARISYMIYLTHQVFLGLLQQLILNQYPKISNYKEILVTILALVTTILFSAFSYYYFEKPILNIGKKFKYYTE